MGAPHGIGFDGNPDLYGVGIRIGYYSAAISLWISNLWAPAEIIFLWPITMTFLVAVLVGVCVLASETKTTYSIEPFMMMQIAYYTYYMSFSAFRPPDLLPWERKYFSYYVTAIVALCLHVFDSWFWWFGLNQMLPTPGTPTLGLFTYFGQQNIYGWIGIVAKIYTTLIIIALIVGIVHNWHARNVHAKLDYEVPPSRLKQLCERWQQDLDPMDVSRMTDKGNTEGLSPATVSRQPSKTSICSAPVQTVAKAHYRSKSDDISISRESTFHSDCDKDDLAAPPYSSRPNSNPPIRIISPEPLPNLDRTTSSAWKRSLLGWTAPPNLSAKPHSYDPSLENLVLASSLLLDVNKATKCRHTWFKAIFYPYHLAWTFAHFLPSFIRHCSSFPTLLALSVHINSLDWARQNFYFDMLRHALYYPSFSRLRPEDITLASRIYYISTPRPKIKAWQKWFWANATFGSCALLMIGTELALQWNFVRGVHELKSVGQLIPAAIGVGGLVKVIWTASLEKRQGEKLCLGACRGKKRRAIWEDACDAWLRVRALWESREKRDTGEA